MAREDALVALVDNQMKIVHLHRIAVPIAPEKLDGLEGQLAGFEIAHEGAAENLFIPERVHALFDRVGKSFRLAGRKLFADFQSRGCCSMSIYSLVIELEKILLNPPLQRGK